MNLFDKLMSGAGKRATTKVADSEAAMKAKLADILYDEDLVNEFAPIFAKLSTQPGFDKVMDLLESKEKQLEAVNGGDWTSNKSDDGTDEEVGNDAQADADSDSDGASALDILKAQFETK